MRMMCDYVVGFSCRAMLYRAHAAEGGGVGNSDSVSSF